MVRPTVHSNPSCKRHFSKTLFKPVSFFNVGGKYFEKGAFPKEMMSQLSCDFTLLVFLRNKCKMLSSVDGEHLMNTFSE